MHNKLLVLLTIMLVLITGCAEPDKPLSDIESVRQQMADVERGRYVIEIMGCNDCHTPDYLTRRSNIPEEDWLVPPSVSTDISVLLTQPTCDYWLKTSQKRIG